MTTCSAAALPAADPRSGPGAVRPTVGAAGAPAGLQCLRCQLLGRRSVTCARGDACREPPLSFPLGPILLAAWLATAIAFVVAVA